MHITYLPLKTHLLLLYYQIYKNCCSLVIYRFSHVKFLISFKPFFHKTLKNVTVKK